MGHSTVSNLRTPPNPIQSCYPFFTQLQAVSHRHEKELIMALRPILLALLFSPLAVAQAPKPAGPRPAGGFRVRAWLPVDERS